MLICNFKFNKRYIEILTMHLNQVFLFRNKKILLSLFSRSVSCRELILYKKLAFSTKLYQLKPSYSATHDNFLFF